MFTEKVANEVCRRLSLGETLRQISKTPGMPAVATVCDWVRERTEFADQYARARNAGLDMMAEQIIEIADTPAVGMNSEADGDGVVTKITTKEMIEHRRLQVDARKWLLSKMRPEKYGDRAAIALTDKDGNNIFPQKSIEDWIQSGENTDKV